MQGFEPEVYVLRIGHRRERDKRVTTHVALAARALGARGFILAGNCDFSVINSVLKVENTWGRAYKIVACGISYIEIMKLWKKMSWPIVHLTMYGLPLKDVLPRIKGRRRPVLVVVGAEKVPREVYELADYNVSVTNQPHSEVSALAIFLDRLYNCCEQDIKFEDAKITVIPSARGKNIKKMEWSGGEGVDETQKERGWCGTGDPSRNVHNENSWSGGSSRIQSATRHRR